jgi:hypothetical protein
MCIGARLVRRDLKINVRVAFLGKGESDLLVVF